MSNKQRVIRKPQQVYRERKDGAKGSTDKGDEKGEYKEKEERVHMGKEENQEGRKTNKMCLCEN